MLQFIADYWMVWFVLFIALRGYIRHNAFGRMKRMETVPVIKDFSGLSEAEVKHYAFSRMRAGLTGTPQYFVAAVLSWVSISLFAIALFALFTS